MSFVSDFRADIARYTEAGVEHRPIRTILGVCGMMYKHPGIWAVLVYRVGRAIRGLPIPGVRHLLLALYYLTLYQLVRFGLGIELPLSCEIGPGLAIWHYGGIIFGGGIRAGKNLSVNSGVMIGRRHINGPIAEIGDNVTINAHALVLCQSVGSGSIIGAGSVVLKDVRPGKTVVGNPAVEKVISTVVQNTTD